MVTAMNSDDSSRRKCSSPQGLPVAPCKVAAATPIGVFTTSVDPSARELVGATLDSTFLSEGKRVAEFEEQLASKLGLEHPVAVNSGTSALHLAMVLAGVRAGDEVILPAQTFVATGLVVLAECAKPIFADIQPQTGNLCPLSVEAKVTPRTRAIVAVHWAGYPCDMEQIHAVAKRYGLVVIEDAAHALGATYKGRPVGSLSDYTCFSFQAIKHLTTGDGGALCCLDGSKEREAKARRWFGIDRANSKPSLLGEREYDISSVGYKYHLNDLAATLGLANLRTFPQRLARRRALAALYRKELEGVSGLELLEFRDDRESAWWLFTVLVERREDFLRALAAEGIVASVVHLRIDHNSVFGGITPDLPGQEAFQERQVSIPLHEGLSNEQVDRVLRVVRRGW